MQGTALFMAGGLLTALVNQELHEQGTINKSFTFQHGLSHDFESLIWVVIYAMMIRKRNILAITDPDMYKKYKEVLDSYWACHSYRNLRRCHNDMIAIGCDPDSEEVEGLWFPEPLEAGFFRDAMRLVRGQVQDREPVTHVKTIRALQKAPPTRARFHLILR
jgi:hypothetical protein